MGVYIVDITLPVDIEADSNEEARAIAERLGSHLFSTFPSKDPGGSGRRCCLIQDLDTIEYKEYGEMDWDEEEDGPFFSEE